ncbi:VOC family protein [Streptomyces aurantiacus]|uniref:Glyoxalase n=1 Tax=Streptomyces aurantiacus TaxID=47760 RepID=A0A7G1P5D8_9ACTN|nr:VOC family protein [Streptomyces aurantiacus]BCL29027.1 glyoxalase [Streptomyces aurantiacus]
MARTRTKVSTVVLDTDDVHVLAGFYRRLLGYEVRTDEPDWVLIGPPPGTEGIGLAFATEREYVRPVWPATKSGEQQMMLHLDIEVDDADDLEGETARAVAEGATLAAYQPQDDVRVLLDPAGHPFCLWVQTPEPEHDDA